jgi:DNA-binding IclR family transcriptional regulator
MSTADRLLPHLRRFTDPETVNETADALHLPKTTVAGALYRLEEQGRATGRVRRLGVAFDGPRAWALASDETRGATT